MRSVAGLTRREVTVGALGCACLLGLGAFGASGALATPSLRPPGAQDERRFTSLCIHCEKCREICPHGALRTLGVEHGAAAMRTPTLDFHRGWCDACEEANDGHPLCAEVCPTRAIEIPVGVQAKDLVMGLAVINEDWCLAYQGRNCKVCIEACPYDALVYDESRRPVVDLDACNGCGLCEHVCISLTSASVAPEATDRAIVVRTEGEVRR